MAVMVCVLATVELYTTAQLAGAAASSAFVLMSVQGLAAKTPLASLEAKVTVPVGVVFVPASVSRTVAVHVVVPPAVNEAGEQLTVVDVLRLVTVSGVLPVLPLCFRSPSYVAVIVCDPAPTAVGVYVTEQLALEPLPESVQVPAALNVPSPLLANSTIPLGVLVLPASVSVTVAVQVVLAPTGSVAGTQDTLVIVVRGRAVTVAAPELMPCRSSPP
jgi:hypothetical protein